MMVLLAEEDCPAWLSEDILLLLPFLLLCFLFLSTFKYGCDLLFACRLSCKIYDQVKSTEASRSKKDGSLDKDGPTLTVSLSGTTKNKQI
jgi:hypothetical protein